MHYTELHKKLLLKLHFCFICTFVTISTICNTQQGRSNKHLVTGLLPLQCSVTVGGRKKNETDLTYRLIVSCQSHQFKGNEWNYHDTLFTSPRHSDIKFLFNLLISSMIGLCRASFVPEHGEFFVYMWPLVLYLENLDLELFLFHII